MPKIRRKIIIFEFQASQKNTNYCFSTHKEGFEVYVEDLNNLNQELDRLKHPEIRVECQKVIGAVENEKNNDKAFRLMTKLQNSLINVCNNETVKVTKKLKN